MSETVHLICNAHLDPVWLWTGEEGVAAALATFETAARLCREYEGFVFNHNEAVLYQWVERYDPALFAEISALVREGRWHIMGGWYLQPDCNMPSGESFVRQILEGRRYFLEKFGAVPGTAINFDPFGHSRGLVQILRRAGYDSYIVCRPGQEDLPLPENDFVWKGFDGSEILVHRIVNGYNSGRGRVREKLLRYRADNPETAPGLCLWGVGNHGGGPSREDLDAIAALRAQGESLCHSTPEQYFAALRDTGRTLPVVERSLNHWGVGCYTSQIRVKQKHRQLESAYFSLEKLAAHAAALGAADYPAAELDGARRDLLFLQFHDILPGTSIRRAEEDALRLADHGLEILARKRLDLFLAMTWGRVAPDSPVTPVYVYNPHPCPVEGIFECELPLAETVREGFAAPVLIQGGMELPVQREQEENLVPIQWRRRMAFRAVLPPYSMERLEFTVRLREAQERPGSVVREGDLLWFRTDRLALAVHALTGLMEVYRVDGRDSLRPGSFLPAVFEDTQDTWGMTKKRYDIPAGTFRICRDERGDPALRVIEDGEVRTVIEAVMEYGRSLLVMRYQLPRVGTEVEVALELTFAEDEKLVKLLLFPAMETFRYLGETAFGVDELPADGRETVAQRWTAAASPERCLTLINDSTYGSSCDGRCMAPTLIKSCGYAAHPMAGRAHVPTGRHIPGSDHIRTAYRFYLNAGPAEERLANVSGEAQRKHEPPMLLGCFSGSCTRSAEPFLQLEPAQILCAAVKPAEDGNGLILRLCNSAGTARSARLKAGPAAAELAFGPYEVKTVRYLPERGLFSEAELLA